MHWKKVTLVGVGLLGGSLGLALKQRKLASRVEGFVRREPSVRECEKLGVVDQAHLNLSAAVRGADLIVLCTPLAQMGPIAERMRPDISGDTLVTDVGSVKASVVRELEPLLANFVGSHPMAGAEKTGPGAATADLFKDAVCILTPTTRSKPESVERIEQFWLSVGAVPRRLSPEIHDELVGRTSHLPHVLAAELVNYVLGPNQPKEQPLLCANGFRDTTRIASGSPEMWRDIAVNNRQNLARELGVFIKGLEDFRRALEDGDAGRIEEFFAEARRRRDQWQEQRGASPE